MSIHKKSSESPASQAIDHEFGILLSQNASCFVDRGLASALAAVVADVDPPSNNMGGNHTIPPPFIPHGEKSGVFVVKPKTKIDWLAYTSIVDLEAIKLGISVLWPSVVFSARSRGFNGYPEALEISVDEVGYGLIGFGADHGRSLVSLTGVACSTLSHEQIGHAYDMLCLIDARLSRLDIALDFYHGERTWDHAYWAYCNTDAFKPARGKKPRHKTIEGQDGDGKNLGRTLNIGVRGESERYIRIYEKGLEVFANLPSDLREASDARALVFSLDDAQFADNWLRVEVEYARQKNDLPLEMLIERDSYFAGSYPYCAECLGLTDGVRPKSLRDDVEIDLIKMIGHGKRAYGSLIHTLKELGFTDAEVVQYMSAGKLNNKLVRSGVLGRIKERQAEILASSPDFDIPF